MTEDCVEIIECELCKTVLNHKTVYITVEDEPKKLCEKCSAFYGRIIIEELDNILGKVEKQ